LLEGRTCPDLGTMSTNPSFAIRDGGKIDREEINVRFILGHANCIETKILASEGGQKQTFVPFRLSVKPAKDPASFASSSDFLPMDGLSNHTMIEKKRKCMTSENTRCMDLLKSLKMRRVDWRYVHLIFRRFHENKMKAFIAGGRLKRAFWTRIHTSGTRNEVGSKDTLRSGISACSSGARSIRRLKLHSKLL
jgi:hypothetical protein